MQRNARGIRKLAIDHSGMHTYVHKYILYIHAYICMFIGCTHVSVSVRLLAMNIHIVRTYVHIHEYFIQSFACWMKLFLFAQLARIWMYICIYLCTCVCVCLRMCVCVHVCMCVKLKLK